MCSVCVCVTSFDELMLCMIMWLCKSALLRKSDWFSEDYFWIGFWLWLELWIAKPTLSPKKSRNCQEVKPPGCRLFVCNNLEYVIYIYNASLHLPVSLCFFICFVSCMLSGRERERDRETMDKKIIKAGTRTETPPPNSIVTVHYAGQLLDGTVFDSSFTRKQYVFSLSFCLLLMNANYVF